MVVYVDTSAWIAFLTKRDAHHEDAVTFLRHALAHGTPLRAGRHTIIELADGIAARKGQAETARIIEGLLDEPRLRVVASEPVHAKAWDLFTKNVDWGVDLSDCLSFALMESLGIRRVFTYDKDFEKAGFEVVG